jgi:hypothetical protein
MDAIVIRDTVESNDVFSGDDFAALKFFPSFPLSDRSLELFRRKYRQKHPHVSEADVGDEKSPGALLDQPLVSAELSFSQDFFTNVRVEFQIPLAWMLEKIATNPLYECFQVSGTGLDSFVCILKTGSDIMTTPAVVVLVPTGAIPNVFGVSQAKSEIKKMMEDVLQTLSDCPTNPFIDVGLEEVTDEAELQDLYERFASCYGITGTPSVVFLLRISSDARIDEHVVYRSDRWRAQVLRRVAAAAVPLSLWNASG